MRVCLHTLQCITTLKSKASVLSLVCCLHRGFVFMDISIRLSLRVFAISLLVSLLLGPIYYNKTGARNCKESCECSSEICCRRDEQVCPSWSPCNCQSFEVFPTASCEKTKNRCDFFQRVLLFSAALSLRVTFACFVYLLFALPVWCCYNVFHSIAQSEDFNWGSMNSDDMELDDRSVTLSIEMTDTE